MLNEGVCMECKQDKPAFSHKIYYKNSVLQFCTSCLLKSNPGKFCPICFKVYDNEDLDFSPPPARCSMCSAVAHFNCILHTSASSSSSNPVSDYVCPSCSNPNFRFFDFPEGEIPDLGTMDMHLGVQVVAASIISERSMKEGAVLCWERAEMKAELAANARKEAKKALELFAELTTPKLDLDDDDSMQNASEGYSDDDYGDEEYDEEENSDEETNSGEEDEEKESEGNNNGEERDEEDNDEEESSHELYNAGKESGGKNEENSYGEEGRGHELYNDEEEEESSDNENDDGEESSCEESG